MDTYSEKNILRIKLIANQVREKHGAMEWGVTPEDLIERQGLQYDEYDLTDQSFIKKITNGIKTIVGKIKAAIIISEKIILIDEDLHHAKKPFGQAHELGHDAIPEHSEILYVCSELDLNINVRKEMEFEANVFASEILFPEPLLKSIHKNFPLSMETIIYMRNISGGSFHSAAIKYVETSDMICCLLILKKKVDDKGNEGLQLYKDQITSPSWWQKYKRLLADNQFFPSNHNLSQVVYSWHEGDFVTTRVSMKESKTVFQAHVFYNQYNAFALLFE